MANNYTPSYNQYRTQTVGYALPSSVRTYSVFDPASNSWRRMTNDGRSPIPTQGQAVVPVQGMGQGQPVEVHPGYLNPPAQGVNIPSRQATKPLTRNNPRTSTRPKISDYVNDDAILRAVDIPPEVTLGTQPVVVKQPIAVNTPINMSPDYRTSIPYISNETVGLAGYNPNIAKTQTQLALGDHYRQSIPARPLTFTEHLARLFNKREAQDALRAATGLPPLE